MIDRLQQLLAHKAEMEEQNRALQERLEAKEAEFKISNDKLSDICNLCVETQSNFDQLKKSVKLKINKVRI